MGRDRELGVLRDALARVRAERSPQLVTLVGVPGIGKSRLVYELWQVAEAEPELISWRQGRSLPYGEGVSFWALAEMVKAQAGILETDSPEAGRGQAGRDGRGRAGAARRRRTGWSGIWARWLAWTAAACRPAGTASEAFAAWRHFFEALAEARPLVLVFEDLHWADDELLDFVDYLADWAGGVPLLVVGTARPELFARRPGWGGGKPNAITLSLAPLSDEDTARLIGSLLGRPVLQAGRRRCCWPGQAAIRCTRSSTCRCWPSRRWREQPPLPETVQGIIAARLDLLAPAEKRLLQDAAVVGKVFWPGAVAALGGGAGHGAGRVPARAGAQAVRPPRAPLVGGRRDAVRVPARAGARCRLRADPAGRPGRQARRRGRLDRVPGPGRRITPRCSRTTT